MAIILNKKGHAYYELWAVCLLVKLPIWVKRQGNVSHPPILDISTYFADPSIPLLKFVDEELQTLGLRAGQSVQLPTWNLSSEKVMRGKLEPIILKGLSRLFRFQFGWITWSSKTCFQTIYKWINVSFIIFKVVVCIAFQIPSG